MTWMVLTDRMAGQSPWGWNLPGLGPGVHVGAWPPALVFPTGGCTFLAKGEGFWLELTIDQ